MQILSFYLLKSEEKNNIKIVTYNNRINLYISTVVKCNFTCVCACVCVHTHVLWRRRPTKATMLRAHESHNGTLDFWKHTPFETAPGSEKHVSR